uniref:Chromo domain-containing protein n=1 Tax=Moniliophthora roreri TaxID=221103 RepID=A0A0W0FRL6_MONRR
MEGRIKHATEPFTVGQKVWLEGKNLNFGYLSKKLAPKQEGPFKIEAVLGPVTYKLALPEKWKVHLVFHTSLLSPYRQNDVHGKNFLKLPPDLIEGQKEHEIEAIIRHSLKRKPQRFLVSWKGYPSAENKWLWEDFEHTQETLADYKKANKLRRILTKTPTTCLSLTATTTSTPLLPNFFSSLTTPHTGNASWKSLEATPSLITSSLTTNLSNDNMPTSRV